VRATTVFTGQIAGVVIALLLPQEEAMSTSALQRPIPMTADSVPVTEIMTRNVVCARPRLSVASLAMLMVRNHISCVPIVDERGHPRGMVTKSDLIEMLDGDHVIDNPLLVSRTAADIMMPIAITLDDRATVAHAASMMAIEGFHHVMIVSQSGALVGLVSSQDVVRWLVENERLAGSTSTCE
jgi:CBS domain-containing protein